MVISKNLLKLVFRYPHTNLPEMHIRSVSILSILIGLGSILSTARASNPDSSMIIRKTADFEVDGTGKASNWSATEWVNIHVQNGPGQKKPGHELSTRFKVLYSEKGMYFLFDNEDKRLTSTILEDFGLLFKEDVVEVFLWPDTSVPIYLEYEISPLDYELVILIPNLKGGIQGWKPWNYNERNKVRHATSAQGGQKKSMAAVENWKAEFFIPFNLMNPMIPETPKSGTVWRGNFYRIDYDQETAYYAWQKTGGSFHEFQKFGTLKFE